MGVNFRELKLYGQKSGKCTFCGKRRVRKHKFTETDNPWNKNDRGEQKSSSEIYASLEAKCRAWENEPITCEGCK